MSWSASSKSGGVANQRRARIRRTVRALMGRNNAVGDDLTGQVLAGPVGDVQALGYGFQAGQFNDLSTLQGKSRSGVPTAGLTQEAG